MHGLTLVISLAVDLQHLHVLTLVPPLRRGYSVVIDFGRVVLLKDLKMLETTKRSSCLLLLLESASTIGNS